MSSFDIFYFVSMSENKKKRLISHKRHKSRIEAANKKMGEDLSILSRIALLFPRKSVSPPTSGDAEGESARG